MSRRPPRRSRAASSAASRWTSSGRPSPPHPSARSRPAARVSGWSASWGRSSCRRRRQQFLKAASRATSGRSSLISRNGKADVRCRRVDGPAVTRASGRAVRSNIPAERAHVGSPRGGGSPPARGAGRRGPCASPVSPVVARDGAQPGGVEAGELPGAAVPGQHADRSFLGAGAELQMAEVVDAGGAEVPLDPTPGAVVVAEEGERRPGGTDDRPDLVAALVGQDGVARRLVRKQYVEAGTAERRRGATADPGAGRDPLAGARGAVIDAPHRPDAQP